MYSLPPFRSSVDKSEIRGRESFRYLSLVTEHPLGSKGCPEKEDLSCETSQVTYANAPLSLSIIFSEWKDSLN